MKPYQIIFVTLATSLLVALCLFVVQVRELQYRLGEKIRPSHMINLEDEHVDFINSAINEELRKIFKYITAENHYDPEYSAVEMDDYRLAAAAMLEYPNEISFRDPVTISPDTLLPEVSYFQEVAAAYFDGYFPDGEEQLLKLLKKWKVDAKITWLVKLRLLEQYSKTYNKSVSVVDLDKELVRSFKNDASMFRNNLDRVAYFMIQIQGKRYDFKGVSFPDAAKAYYLMNFRLQDDVYEEQELLKFIENWDFIAAADYIDKTSPFLSDYSLFKMGHTHFSKILREYVEFKEAQYVLKNAN